MRVSAGLVERWAAGADAQGRCGSGWVVGRSGVFSCRHVVVPAMRTADDRTSGLAGVAEGSVIQIRPAGAGDASGWVDWPLAWQHPRRDLILLRVTPGRGQSWEPPAER